MKNKLLFTAALAGACILSGCDDKSSPGGSTQPSPPPKQTPSTSPGPTTPKADNTGVNKRDSDSANKTPMDQSNTKADIDITAAIRKTIMGDKAMSTDAQNVKIITEKGKVTLRGVVDTQVEKDAIDAYARATTGVTTVDNQLEVKKPQ